MVSEPIDGGLAYSNSWIRPCFERNSVRFRIQGRKNTFDTNPLENKIAFNCIWFFQKFQNTYKVGTPVQVLEFPPTRNPGSAPGAMDPAQTFRS